MERVAAHHSKNHVGAHSICARGGLRRRERARADFISAPTILFSTKGRTPPYLLSIILRNGGAAYPMIPQEYIQEVVRRNDIEEVIGQYVQLRRRGRTATGLCPFHNEKTPSFVVYPDTQSFYCFAAVRRAMSSTLCASTTISAMSRLSSSWRAAPVCRCRGG